MISYIVHVEADETYHYAVIKLEDDKEVKDRWFTFQDVRQKFPAIKSWYEPLEDGFDWGEMFD